MLPADLSLLHALGRPAVLPDGSATVLPVLRPDLTTDEYRGHLWRVSHDDTTPTALTRGHRDTDPDVSSDGRWVAFTRSEPKGRPQVFVVESTGGEPVRVTDVPQGASAPRFSPDGRRIAFLSRVPDAGRYEADGDPSAEAPRHITELSYRMDDVGFTRDRPRHLFVVDMPSLADAALDASALDAPPAGTAPSAAPAGAEAADQAREPAPAGTLGAVTQLTTGPVGVRSAAWAPDGASLVVVAARHADRERDLRVDAVRVPARGGDVLQLEPVTDADKGSTLCVEAALPARDGTGTWLLASDLSETGLDFVAATTGLWWSAADGEAPVRLTDAETVDLESAVLVETGDGDAPAVLVAEQRRGAVHLVRVERDGTSRDVVGGTWVVTGAASAAGVVVATAAGPGSGGELLCVRGGEPVQVTALGAALHATGRLRLPRELTAAAPDGYPVHGWVTTPDPARHPGPRPTILMVHGGPFAQYTHGLFDEVQTLAEAGYAVVQANPRGSSGYGRAHGRAIRGAFGTVDADDVLALLDHALALPGHDVALDPERVGVMGGSYGGYLTAWLTTRTHRFAAAIVERGFLDPVSFVGSSDIGWFFGLEYLGDAVDDESARVVAAQSPMAHVGAVRTPTLVIHSEQDWRCPVEQGQRWFVELKRRGVHAELLLFPGEGHELTRSGRPRHRLARFEHVLRWWSEHLPAGAPER